MSMMRWLPSCFFFVHIIGRVYWYIYIPPRANLSIFMDRRGIGQISERTKWPNREKYVMWCELTIFHRTSHIRGHWHFFFNLLSSSPCHDINRPFGNLYDHSRSDCDSADFHKQKNQSTTRTERQILDWQFVRPFLRQEHKNGCIGWSIKTSTVLFHPVRARILKTLSLTGPISSVTVLGKTLIIINDRDLAFQILEKNSIKHSSRPHLVYSASGAFILTITYGYNIEPRGEDPLVRLANLAVKKFSEAAVPGAWLVDFIPACRFLPYVSLEGWVLHCWYPLLYSEICSRMDARGKFPKSCQRSRSNHHEIRGEPICIHQGSNGPGKR